MSISADRTGTVHGAVKLNGGSAEYAKRNLRRICGRGDSANLGLELSKTYKTHEILREAGDIRGR